LLLDHADRGILAHNCICNHLGFEGPAERAKARKEAGVGALIFDSYPIRYWDEWLGPRTRRLFAATLDGADPETKPEPRGLTGAVAPATFLESQLGLSPDGKTLYTTWVDYSESPKIIEDLVAIDVESGERRSLTHGDAWYAQPKVSPDGRFVVCIRGTFGSPTDSKEAPP
jgi:hypothetical protein